MNKKKNYILSFLIPVTIFLIVATAVNILPFGKMLFNNYDSYTMYPNLLIGSIKSYFNGEFFYTFKLGLGADLYNIRTLYMNSPLNLLLLLFGYKNVYLFITFLIYLRIGLLGLTMNIYLNSLTKKNKYNLSQILFSSIYALTTFSIACSFHIMWIDSLILLPLIILGLDRLIEKESSKLYIIFLSIAIFINYYIGYMICIFCVIYFLYKSYITKKLNKKTIKRFLISSILSGFICAIIIIPQIISLMGGRGNNFSIAELKGISKFSLSSLIFNYFPCSYIVLDNYSDGSTLTYVTLIVLLFDILYFFNKKIDKKEKKATFIVILLFTLCSFVNFLDFSWNMFQAPIWWSHRYIFVYCFFLIVTAYKCYLKKDGIKITNVKKIIIQVLVIILSLVSFSIKLMGLYLNDTYVAYLAVGLILFVVYFNLYNVKKFEKILLILLIFEVFINTFVILDVNSIHKYSDAKSMLNSKKYFDNLKEFDKDVYRTINTNYNSDDSMFLEYNSPNLFSSSYNNLPKVFLADTTGVFNDDINRIQFTFDNPAVSSLLGIKYFVGDNNYYDEVDDNIYLNENALGIGYVVSSDLKSIELIDGDYFNNIEKIYSVLTKEDIKLFNDIEYKDSLSYKNLIEEDNILTIEQVSRKSDGYNVTYEFIAPSKGLLIPNDPSYYNKISFSINDGEKIENLKYQNYIMVEENDKVLVDFTFHINNYYKYGDIDINDLGFKILDVKELNRALNIINDNPRMTNLSTKDSVLSGNISVNENSTLLITLPYQKGFTIYVDGKKQDYYKLMDTFIGIDLQEGNHKIKITYISPGFVIGGIVSTISLLLAILYFKKY